MTDTSKKTQSNWTWRGMAHNSNRRRWQRIVVWGAVGLLALLMVAAGCFVLWLRGAEKAALPLLDGEIRLAGLKAPVAVRRDEHGVPHIEAASEEDLWVAQGYVTAQDRLWQMDTYRRNSNGELAEVLGSALVNHDKLQRVLGIRRTAERIWANTPPDQRARFEAYARGVNLFIAEHENNLPAEFRLLGYKPRPWTGVDSISVGLTMVQMLDTHWEDKLSREAIRNGLNAYAEKVHQQNPKDGWPDVEKLEKELYPVGSWRDHPPTGERLDLSKPHPEPAKRTGDDDDEDDNSQAKYREEGEGRREQDVATRAQGARARQAAEKLLGVEVLKGHGFSRVSKGLPPTQGDENASAVSAPEGPKDNSPGQVRRSGRSPGKGQQESQSPVGAAEISPQILKGIDSVFDRADEGNKLNRALAPEGWHFTKSSEPSRSPATQSAGDLALTAQDLRGLREAGLGGIGLGGCADCVYGSNNWVVAGSHTASGKPLLASDMHLGLTQPNIWYMADLKAPGYHAAGVTVPGVPFVIAGHNEHVAWGFTALYADVQGLYVEKVQGSNYEGNDADWHPLKVNHETIKVRGGADVQLDVQETEHGPLLNPVLPKEKRAIALKWTLYDPSLNTLPVYELNKAANWGEFEEALKSWCWPTQNVVYADDQGHISYRAIGKVPVHKVIYGYPFPHDTMNLRAEWAIPGVDYAYIPFDDMPHTFDPPSGFLATANSRVTTEESPHPLTLEWPDPYRAERIYRLLDGRNGLTRADMLTVQTDIYSEVDQEIGHRLAYAIDHTDGVDERLKKAADLMRSWDGRLTTDSAAASVVTQARQAFWPLILEPKLGKELAAEYRWAESNFAEEEIVMHGGSDSNSGSHSAWLPPGYKNWDALLTDAVRKGMEAGHAPGDVAAWSYGSWHVVDIEHPLAKFLPGIGGFAGTGEQPLSGGKLTIKQVGREFGPSQRFTMDWSDVDGSTENIVLGESGDPYSPYYRDQWKDYYGGTTFALPFSDAAVTAQTRHTLRLTP
jgi:acyl-homoserine lactone acylase PvdQ